MASKHGKICYNELPATDPQKSADFYREIFGWNIRTRGDGAISFDDTIGEVSGSFDPDKKAVPHPGFPHGMCTTEADTINADLLAFIQS